MLRTVRARLLALLLLLPLAAAGQDDEPTYSEPEVGERFHVVGWGGTLLDLRGDSSGAGHVGGEVAYSFESLDVGILGEGYRLNPSRAKRPWTPVVLLRLEQRFETRRGLEAV